MKPHPVSLGTSASSPLASAHSCTLFTRPSVVKREDLELWNIRGDLDLVFSWPSSALDINVSLLHFSDFHFVSFTFTLLALAITNYAYPSHTSCNHDYTSCLCSFQHHKTLPHHKEASASNLYELNFSSLLNSPFTLLTLLTDCCHLLWWEDQICQAYFSPQKRCLCPILPAVHWIAYSLSSLP